MQTLTVERIKTLPWKSMPSNWGDEAVVGRFEVAPPFLVRRKASRGASGKILLPVFASNQSTPRYSLRVTVVGKCRQFHLSISALTDLFGLPKPTADTVGMIRDVIEQYNLDLAVAKAKQDEAKTTPYWVRMSCPWKHAQIHGPAMGADPVLGF